MGDRLMANRLKKKKPEVRKSAIAGTEPEEATVANDQSIREAGDVSSLSKDVFNAETAQVLRDADAGRNLTHYVDEGDLFRKLGIAIGKG
jgi:hypothetical protein